MWYGVDSITGCAGAAVLCSLTVQFLSSRDSEISSEIVCWILLPFLSLFWEARWSYTRVQRPVFEALGSRGALWVVAVGIAITCLYRAELDRKGLFPILTTLVLVAENHLRPELHTSNSPNSSIFFSLANTIWGTTIAATFAIFSVSDWDLRDYVLSLIPIVAMLVFYVALIPRPIGGYALRFIYFETAIYTVGVRVLIILSLAFGIQTYLFGLPGDGLFQIGSLGLFKSLAWLFTIKTISNEALSSKSSKSISTTPEKRQASWCIATIIETFSIVSNVDISMQPSGIKAISQVIASCLAIAQLIYLLPKQAKAKHILWLLVLFSILPYLVNVCTIQSSISDPNEKWEHPVEALVRHAKVEFERRMDSQSKNHTEAHEEYQRRYNVDPPPGFKAWYEYAAANESPIIDEFNMINEMISPFRKLSGKEVVENMKSVEDQDLWTCTFSRETSKTKCTHPWRSFDRNIESSFNELLGETKGILPDVKFLVNHLDEPRVIIPTNFPNRDTSYTGYKLTTDLSEQPSWNELTIFCNFSKSSQDDQSSIRTYGLPFVTNITAAMDLCQHREYSSLHGLFISPTSLNLIEGLYPILSTGTLSTMGDILFPSPAYLEPEFTYNPKHDIPWSQKSNALYWVGSTTGGYASDSQWRSFHRQRFVSIAQNLHKKNTYLKLKSGAVQKQTSKWLNGRTYHVFFTRIFQSSLPSSHAQRSFFHTKPWISSPTAAYTFTLTFDLDGNGISGRFYKLLASNSVPLKQTVLREWHDERLVPWVHYFPVSLSMKEMPELVRFLTMEERGRMLAERVAREGKVWFGRACAGRGRAVYLLRLLLEVARLGDVERVGEGVREV